DHHREHPVLGAGGTAVVAPVDQGFVVGEGQAEDVAEQGGGHLEGPDDGRGQGVEVDAVFGGAEEVGGRGPQGVGEEVGELGLLLVDEEAEVVGDQVGEGDRDQRGGEAAGELI